MAEGTRRERIAKAALGLFAAVVIAWGLSGILLPRVWLERAFDVPLDAMSPVARGSLLAEFRFLQARELGVGVLTIALLPHVLGDRRIRRAFLVAVAASPLARLLALLVDGMPAWWSCGFLVAEAAMALVLWLLTAR